MPNFYFGEAFPNFLGEKNCISVEARREMIGDFYQNVWYKLGIDELPELFREKNDILDLQEWKLGDEELFNPA
jgi:hypothetical protein